MSEKSLLPFFNGQLCKFLMLDLSGLNRKDILKYPKFCLSSEFLRQLRVFDTFA